MSFRSLQHNYHDSQLISHKLGPRRELTLQVALDPVWNEGLTSAVIRFGGIRNYDEIASFFNTLPEPPQADAYVAEIIGLEYLPKGHRSLVIDIADHGHVHIHAQNVSEL
jgi:hypothetical protein